MLALLAGLHHREIEHTAARQFAGKKSREHELVIERVRQISPTPGHLCRSLDELGAMQKAVGLGINPARDLDLPSRLDHRLDRDDASRDLHAQAHGRRSVAAVRHAEHGFVRSADGGLLLFERDMGEGGRRH
jgi:hypothetical protein